MKASHPTLRAARFLSACLCGLLLPFSTSSAEEAKPKSSDFPPAEKVLEGYKKVVSTMDGKSFYNLYVNPKTQHVLAELPRDFKNQKHFIALTISSGESYAGLQAGDLYVRWEVFNQKRLALIQPNLESRSTGDDESKNSVKRLFTDRVLLDIPILTYQSKGGPPPKVLIEGGASMKQENNLRVK